MRLRNKNWTKDYIAKNKKYMVPDGSKVELKKLFKNNNKSYLEIGCGKGKFIIENARKNDSKNFIAMEKETTVIGVALKNALNFENFELNNLLFLNSFAEKLTKIFYPNSFKGIYLNFSDPWPKSKHYKKRLVYISFLDIYWELLENGGTLEIKTDNDGLYEFGLQQIENSKFEIIFNTTDLYGEDEFLKNNVQTEYEQKFHSMGKNINKIVIKKEV